MYFSIVAYFQIKFSLDNLIKSTINAMFFEKFSEKREILSMNVNYTINQSVQYQWTGQ